MHVDKQVGIALEVVGLTLLVAASIFNLAVFWPVFGMGCLVVGTYKVIRQLFKETTTHRLLGSKMKERAIYCAGAVLMIACIAMLLTHSYFTFFADVAPYNLSKGHLEVGFLGLVFFSIARPLLAHRTTDKG